MRSMCAFLALVLSFLVVPSAAARIKATDFGFEKSADEALKIKSATSVEFVMPAFDELARVRLPRLLQQNVPKAFAEEVIKKFSAGTGGIDKKTWDDDQLEVKITAHITGSTLGDPPRPTMIAWENVAVVDQNDFKALDFPDSLSTSIFDTVKTSKEGSILLAEWSEAELEKVIGSYLNRLNQSSRPDKNERMAGKLRFFQIADKLPDALTLYHTPTAEEVVGDAAAEVVRQKDIEKWLLDKHGYLNKNTREYLGLGNRKKYAWKLAKDAVRWGDPVSGYKKKSLQREQFEKVAPKLAAFIGLDTDKDVMIDFSHAYPFLSYLRGVQATATCDTFTHCSGDTPLNKGRDVACSAGRASCDESICCQASGSLPLDTDVTISSFANQRGLYAKHSQDGVSFGEDGVGAGFQPNQKVGQDGFWHITKEHDGFRFVNQFSDSDRALYSAVGSTSAKGVGAHSPSSDVGADGVFRIIKEPDGFRIVGKQSARALYAEADGNWEDKFGARSPSSAVGSDGIWLITKKEDIVQ